MQLKRKPLDGARGLVRRFLSGLLIGGSFLAILMGVMAWFDPAGTKMADDNDPFGPAPSRSRSAMIVGLGAVGVLIGSRVLRARHNGTV